MSWDSEITRGGLRTIVGWDKDSTLVSTEHRQHLVPLVKAGELSWEDYALACAGDQFVEGAVALMRLLAPHHLQFVMTGADNSAKHLVQASFTRQMLPVDRLMMKPRLDTIDNGELKVRWIKGLERQGFKFVLFVEDWPETADMIRQLTGVPVLVLNPCYPAELEAAKKIRMGNV